MKALIEKMASAGMHFAFPKSRRHPTVKPYIFGVKGSVELFDLEKTAPLFEAGMKKISEVATAGGLILFVGGKSEIRELVKQAAIKADRPYVASRWIGGVLTNFTEIRKRVDKYLGLVSDREKGELAKYTKLERLLIDRTIAKMEAMFLGIVALKEIPKLIVMVDPRKEKNAVAEAIKMNVPIVALAGSDCNIGEIKYPVLGNDSTSTSVSFFLDSVVKAIGTPASK